ncbi:N-acetylmuramoyl-L-alanine amidase [Endozoicomonas sp. (ex Bugula neritina AB1)]|nr:N-acetylmuramoyl-L-alanine amidase [Endozoicomonas sp. (ex Bugula neritina AB1)]
MALNVNRMSSPNYDDRIIPVEFLILHYTAVSLKDTLDIFLNPEVGVSAHLVIDKDGSVYEMVDCLDGRAMRAWHAGVSEWQGWQSFNDFSIGIELVNYNGNVFEYTDEQYESLKAVVAQLQRFYPELCDPQRVLGHEHIAGRRGKVDPGACFDWSRFFAENYSGFAKPERVPTCKPEIIRSLRAMVVHAPEDERQRSQFWQSASAMAEASRRLTENRKIGLKSSRTAHFPDDFD